MCKSKNDFEREKATEKNGGAFPNLLKDRRDLKLLNENSTIATESKIGAGSSRKISRNNDEPTPDSQTKSKMRKAFHMIGVAYCVVSAYGGFGNKTDCSYLFESETFWVLLLLMKF